jgi:hypothetical protein
MMLLFWVGLCLLLSFIGGWIRLSINYKKPEDKVFTGVLNKVYNASMGIAGYQYLMLGLDKDGLYLNAPLLLRIGHPPLYIPWDQITAKTKKSLFAFINIQLCFKANPDIKFNLSETNAKRIGLSTFIKDYPSAAESEVKHGDLKRFALYFLNWLIFAVLVFYSMNSQSHLIDSYKIIRNGSQTSGIITGNDGKSRPNYFFTVNHVKYANSGYYTGYSKDIGSKVKVYYEKTNPNNSTLYDPTPAMKTDLTMLLFVLFVFVPVGLFIMSIFR